jgi:hypothetical protein
MLSRPGLLFAIVFATLAWLGASNVWAAGHHGIAVLAQGSSKDDAWPLAQAIYADAMLRPSLDEKRARALAGEDVEDMKDLVELRAGVKGDDAASRQLLSTIADQLSVDAILVVSSDGTGHTTARSFSTSTKAFDAAVYVARRDGDVVSWPGVIDSLHERWTAPPTPVPPATKPKAVENAISKPFYLSPWFWGAIGAALVGGLAIVLATQDASGDSLRLQLKVPAR